MKRSKRGHTQKSKIFGCPFQRKGQVFTLDFFIGLFAFIALLVIGFTQLFNLLPSTEFEQLHEDSVYISTVLIESGYPSNWNETSVLLPGIADSHLINVTKLENFEKISYEYSKILLHTSSEYVFFFENKTDYLNLSNCTYGYPIDFNQTNCKPNLNSINYKNLIKTQRLLAHNGSIVMMTIYTWRR